MPLSRDERRSALVLALTLAGYWLLDEPVRPLIALLVAVTAAAVPKIGLTFLFLTIPLVTLTRPIGPISLSSTELLLAAIVVGTVLRPGWAACLPRTRFDRGIALFLASALLSLLVTEYMRLSLRELRTLILEPILAFFLLLRWFDARSVVLPLAGLLGGTLAVALVGLLGGPLGWGTSAAEGVVRLQAIYQSPNHLGLVLGRSLPWLVALAWASRSPWRLVFSACGLVVLAGLAMTFSLGAWLGSLAGLLTVAGLLGGRRWVVPGAAVASLAGLAVLTSPRVARIWSHLEAGSGTAYFRIQLWQSALAMIRDHPILGVGLDNFLYLYQQRYILPSALSEANLSHPHNFVLQLWLQLGLTGLVAGLWLLIVASRQAVAAARAEHHSTVSRALGAGAAGSLTDYLVHGAIDNSYFLPDLALIFWLTLAILQLLGPAQLQWAPGWTKGESRR